MKNKTHLFRSGYEIEEMIKRIPASAFNTEISEVKEFIQPYSEEITGDGQFKKEEFISNARKLADEEEFNKFINSLFENKGKKGDPFNFRLFEPYTDLSFEALLNETPDRKGNDVTELTSGELDQVFHLTDWKPSSDSSSVDFQFKTAKEREDLTSDDDLPVKVIRKKDDKVVREYDSDYIIRAPFRHRIEARAYTEQGIIIVSNFSGVNKNMQEDIVTIIEQISERGEN